MERKQHEERRPSGRRSFCIRLPMTLAPYRTLRGWIVLAAATVCLGLGTVPAASAHKLSGDTARAAANKQAKKIKRQTGAKASKVAKCRRKSRHHAVCNVRSHYRTGARTCVTKVHVRYRNHRQRRPRSGIGRTLCS